MSTIDTLLRMGSRIRDLTDANAALGIALVDALVAVDRLAEAAQDVEGWPWEDWANRLPPEVIRDVRHLSDALEELAALKPVQP